ncbi:hypothetical protein G9C85_04330 [Halorubellus sp. JP-L1]|uniref:hypothetical protein n=1 Tax=Halorubellus sp. JP-L1 TaxID=2715753 RepID=UPI00140DA470|nr:hypothetical protein [Halorubellus sp. JP-L1]NHN40861.1 hypothetical protein [Halorubellus sp. JP-L1]
MDLTESSTRAESESDVGSEGATDSGGGYLSTLPRSLWRRVDPGAVAAVVGGTSALRGLRAFRRGDRRRGLGSLALGAALLGVAFVQGRRSRDHGGGSGVDQTDVVDTAPDVDAVASEDGDVGADEHVGGDAAEAVADTSPDIEAASSGLESETDDETESSGADASGEASDIGEMDESGESIELGEPGDVSEESRSGTTGDAGDASEVGETTLPDDADRLGEAAFDRQSREVPVPQRAFNQGFLSHSAEAFWGIRSDDDAVLVSGDYDAVEAGSGVRYVASSEIGADARELPIPDAVLDHWDEVLRGGTAVAGGDDILFVTTEDLERDGLLRVLPAAWVDESFTPGTP